MQNTETNPANPATVIRHADLADELARLKSIGLRVTRMAVVRGGYILETTIEAEPELNL